MYPDLNPNITSLTPNPLQLVLNSRSRLRKRTTESIFFPKPLLLFNDIGLIYPNTINIIQGKTGVHKSRLVESTCSCLLAKEENDTGNFIGITKADPKKRFRVVYVDTERNEQDQLPFALQQIKKMAGYALQDQVPNFEFFSLIQVPRGLRHQALQEYLELLEETDPGVETIVILDVITDCVGNFNDPRDSMGLTDFLNHQISQRNVTFICVIHENPGGGDKARGHLGTELMNKASTLLQIAFQKDGNGRDTELLLVSTLKNRSQAKMPPVYMRFDATKRALVLAEDELIQLGADSKRTKLTTMDLLDFLNDELIVPTPCNEVVTMVEDHFKCGKSTVLERLKDALDLSTKQQISAKVKGPILIKEKSGKNSFYSIKHFLDGSR